MKLSRRLYFPLFLIGTFLSVPIYAGKDPKIEELGKEIAKLISAEIETAKARIVKPDLPPTTFSEDAPVITPSPFEVRVDGANVDYSKEGALKPLTEEQLHSIFKNGSFVIHMKDSKDDQVWKVKLISGADKLALKLKENKDGAKEMLLEVPKLWTASDSVDTYKGPSVRQGLQAIVDGIYHGISLVVGLPETHKKYPEEDIEKYVEQSKRSLRMAYQNESDFNKDWPGLEANIRKKKRTQIDEAIEIEKANFRILHPDEADFNANWPATEEKLRKKMKAEVVADHEEVIPFSLPPEVYGAEKYKDGDLVRYRPKEDMQVKISTKVPGWRLMTHATEFAFLVWHALHGLWIHNLRNGPLGTKALFTLKDKAPASYTVNSTTGNVEVASTRSSYIGGMKNIVNNAHYRRARYLSRPDGGMLGEMGRPLNAAAVYGEMGAGLAVRGIGQPLLTGVNVAATAALSVLAVPGAATLSLGHMLWNMFLYDTMAPNNKYARRLPMAWIVLGELGVLGAGQIAFSVGASATLVGVSALRLAGGSTLIGMQALAELVIFSAFKKWGRQPAEDGYWATKTSGGNSSVANFYKLDAEIALFCLQARLEMLVLDQVRAQGEQAIHQAQSEGQLVMKKTVEEIMGAHVDVTSMSAYSNLQAQANTVNREFQKEVSDRRARLGKQAQFSVPLHDLRMNAAALKVAREKGLQVFNEIMVKYPVELNSGLSHYGFKDKSHEEIVDAFYQELFNSSILIPLEESAYTSVSQVMSPDVTAWFNKRFQEMVEG